MEDIIEFVNNINKIEESKYFIKLKDKPNVNNFILSQQGFVLAVDTWSKLLAHLIIILPSYKHRKNIIANLYDEHGNDDESKAHVITFSKFLQSLGNKTDVLPECTYISTEYVKKFIERLEDCFRTKDWVFCTSMLGMIEYTYVKVSKMLHEYAKNYVEEDKIEHYSLHETLDIKHATDMFKIVEDYYKSKNLVVQSGMIYGYNTIYKLYEDLSQFL